MEQNPQNQEDEEMIEEGMTDEELKSEESEIITINLTEKINNSLPKSYSQIENDLEMDVMRNNF